MNKRPVIVAVVALAVLAGCATVPTGPSSRVMPAPGKPFDVFVREDETCRQYAARQIGIEPNQAATQSAVGTAAAGTAIGATAGALINGRSGAAGGAAAGLVVGSMVGAGAGSSSGYQAQRRYDIAYEQCMYASGNQVPGAYARQHAAPPAPSSQNYPPPPPPSSYR